MAEIDILPYHLEAASYHDWDPRAPRVAAALIHAISSEIPEVTVEHVGSTSVPGCGGKGIIDLMLMYPPGDLEITREALERFGLQHQAGSDPFPEERPMRVGALRYDGTEFRIHVHVIASDSPEVSEFRVFREALREHPELMAAYMARKHEILAAGITNSTEYARTKGSFCQEVLADTSARSTA